MQSPVLCHRHFQQIPGKGTCICANLTGFLKGGSLQIRVSKGKGFLTMPESQTAALNTVYTLVYSIAINCYFSSTVGSGLKEANKKKLISYIKDNQKYTLLACRGARAIIQSQVGILKHVAIDHMSQSNVTAF